MSLALGLAPLGGAGFLPDLRVAPCDGFEIIALSEPVNSPEARLVCLVRLGSVLRSFLPLSPAATVNTAQAIAYLQPRRAQIVQALQQADGLCEFVVAIETSPLTASPEIMVEQGAGRGWLRARAQAGQALAARERDLRRWAAVLLEGVAVEWQLKPAPSGAHLVLRMHKSRAADWQAEFATRVAMSRPEFICAAHVTGPWPLLHFAREVLDA